MTAKITSQKSGLQVSERIEAKRKLGELTDEQVDDFRDFLARVDRDFMNHRVITDNEYTKWFQTGQASDDELRHFVTQFSVFSNLFLKAALLKVINSPTIEQSRASREILLNELGVIYRKDRSANGQATALSEDQKDREGDPDLVATEGTVDGGVCRFRAAHFEWMAKVAEGVGLSYANIGKRRHGRPSTLHFCDELERLYGSEDAHIAEGASFAVENWAAAGFWQELEDGLMRIQKERLPHLKIAFFTWHNRVEATHAGHTMEELEEVFFGDDFDSDKFFQGGREVLDAIAVFWDGLNEDRLKKVCA